MVMLEVIAKKKKELTVKMETVTLLVKVHRFCNVQCINCIKSSVKYFFSDLFFEGGAEGG